MPSEKFTADEHEQVLTAIIKAADPDHYADFPRGNGWRKGKPTKKTAKQMYDLYNRFGQALGEKNIELTWSEKAD